MTIDEALQRIDSAVRMERRGILTPDQRQTDIAIILLDLIESQGDQ